MLQDMDNLKAGNISAINPSKAMPLMVWSSGLAANVPVCKEINRAFFGVKPKMVLSYLNANMSRRFKFLRYPKPKKLDDKKVIALRPHLKKIYNWSDYEFNTHLELVFELKDDKAFIEWVRSKVGFEKKECKLFGLEFNDKKEKFTKRQSKSLFDF